MTKNGSNRRDFLKAASLSAAGLSLTSPLLSKGKPGTAGARVESGPPAFASLASIFEAPRSRFFGVKREERFESFGDGRSGRRWKLVPRDPETCYLADGVSGDEEPHSFQLSFEITNNRILCSATQGGLLKNPCIFSRMVPAMRRGRALSAEELVGGSAWSFGLNPKHEGPVRLPMTHGVQLVLLGSVFPLFQYRVDDLSVELLAFAPMAVGEIDSAPKALICVVKVHNRGNEAWEGSLLAPALPDLAAGASAISTPVESPHPRFTELPVPIAPGYEAVMCLDQTRWNPRCPEVALSLPPEGQYVGTFALLLGRGADDLSTTGSQLLEHSALHWFNQTWAVSQERYGKLSVASAPYFSESYIRLIEVTSSASLYSDEARLFRGGPSGCVDYGMMLFEPRFLADTLRSLGGYRQRTEGAPDRESLAASLVNSLGLLPSAGLYYRATNDRSLFEESPGILEFARQRLKDILSLRRGEPFLFPSEMLWDGPTQGDYHTGSNIMAWLAFQGAGRIAREVYGEVALGREWEEIAGKIKLDIYRHCVGESSLGPRFFEGGNVDGTFAPGHNGEEAFTTLAPFFGFCEMDDPALMNHAKLAFTQENPLYEPAVDGIWWGSRGDRFSGITSPGQLAMLVANSNETELETRLGQLRCLTDLDGSIWWWPYLYPCNDPKHARRRDWPVDTSKSGFTMSIAACLLVHNVFGLAVDVPARQVAFRPFCPWNRFTWEGARLGNSTFDVAYESEKRRRLGSIRNGNPTTYQAAIELMLEAGQRIETVTLNGKPAANAQLTSRFGRPAVRVDTPVAQDASVELVVTVE